MELQGAEGTFHQSTKVWNMMNEQRLSHLWTQERELEGQMTQTLPKKVTRRLCDLAQKLTERMPMSTALECSKKPSKGHQQRHTAAMHLFPNGCSLFQFTNQMCHRVHSF